MAVTIRVPAAVRLATVGRLPQARCPAGLVNPCRVLRAGRAAPLRAGRRGRQPGPAGEQVAEHSEGVLAILAGGGQVGADREERPGTCLLYTSDAADDLTRVDLGGRRIIKKQ